MSRTTAENVRAAFHTLALTLESYYGIPYESLSLRMGNSSYARQSRVVIGATNEEVTGPLGCSRGETYDSMHLIIRTIENLDRLKGNV